MILAMLSSCLFGCASIFNSPYQDFKIVTNNNMDVGNTRCVLSNYRGSWLGHPDNTLIIHRDNNVLDIQCENYYQFGRLIITPDFQGLYLVNDVLFGAVITSLYDDYTGAFYQYQPISAIEMKAK
jgi:hypothetical protein